MFDIQDATQCSFDQLRLAMQQAFSDYSIPLSLSAEAFELMMRQRGLDRSRSRIAIKDGAVVAIWLVSVRGSQAYLISSGTVPSQRAQGISRALAQACLAGLRQDAIGSFQTEVLRDNETAAGLYASLGMTKHRLLDCYTIPAPTAAVASAANVTKADWRDIAPLAAGLRDWAPSWQNADASLDAIREDVTCLRSDDSVGLSGFAVVGNRTGNLHQIAVRRDIRRHGIGVGLIRAVQLAMPQTPLRVTNVQHDDEGFGALMGRVGAVQTTGQYELLMAISGVTD